MRKYRPSNGSEGMMFMDSFCDRCKEQNPIPEGNPQCMVLMRTLIHNIDDVAYPSEWTYKEDETPTCTKFQYKDWNDPNWDEEHQEVNPDQTSLFNI